MHGLCHSLTDTHLILQSAPSEEQQPAYALWSLHQQRKWQMSYLFQVISHQGFGILPGTLDPVLFTSCILQGCEQAKILPWYTHKVSKTSICSSTWLSKPAATAGRPVRVSNEAHQAQSRQDSGHEEIASDFAKKVWNGKILYVSPLFLPLVSGKV